MTDVLDFDFGDEQEEEPEPLKAEIFLSNVLKSRTLTRFNPCDLHGALRILTFKTEADKDYDAGTTFTLCQLPQSQIRVLGSLCCIDYKLSCKSARLGWSKFKRRTGQKVEANIQGFGEVKDVKGVGSFLEHLPTQTLTLDSLEGVFLNCMAGNPGKKGDIVEGYIVYIKQ